MKRSSGVMLGSVCLITVLWFSPAIAADPAPTNAETKNVDTANVGEDVNFSFGKVVKASDNELVVREPNWESETEEETEVSYVIDSSTTLENMKSISEVQAQDDVEIYFKDEGGKKKAVSVSKYSPDDEEDQMNSDETPGNNEEIINASGNNSKI